MKHFGTDGIRGKAEIFDEEYLHRIAYGIYRVGFHRVVIGRDTRESGERISKAICRHLVHFGVDITDVGIASTPMVAYLVEKTGSDGGIVVSASHNPPDYNGIKLFDKNGKLTEEEERTIEKYMEEPALCERGKGAHKLFYCAGEWYGNYIKSVVHADLSGLKVSLDLSNGSARRAPELFRAMGAEVFVHNDRTDGKKINVNCGATHPESIAAAVREDGADIGFAYDGDGDRVVCVRDGVVITGDGITCLLAKGMKKRGLLSKDAVVGTVMSNMGTEIYLNNNGIDFVRADVGDRNVAKKMKSVGSNLGGEDSGHIILSDVLPTGDGVLTSLVVASLLHDGERFDNILAYPTATEEVYADDGVKRAFAESERIAEYLHDFTDCRVVVRPSGTENKIRILFEGKDDGLVKSRAQAIKKFLESNL